MEKKNLKKLTRSAIPMKFIREHDAVWGKEQWSSFCRLLESKGYMPINLEDVRQLLENRKADYLAKKSNG